MSDFNYEIERTDHYSLVNAILYGESVQDGTPTPSNPVDIQVVEPVNGTFGINVNGTVTTIDLQGNVLASLPDGTRDRLLVDSAGHVTLEKRVEIIEGGEAGTSAYYNSTNHAKAIVFSSKPYPGGINSLQMLSDQFEFDGPKGDASGAKMDVGKFGYYYVSSGATPWYIYIQPAETITSQAEVATWLTTHKPKFYYPLATPETIDLGYIDLSYLQDIPDEIPISFVSTLTPDSTYLYENIPSYEVKNPYEDYNAPEYAYPPNHFGQEWETFDANDWNVSEMLDYTGQPESHAVYTVELCELMQSGAFNWSRPELDWSEAAYSQDQYKRFCKYFEQRFMFREISMLPPLQWFTALKRMLVYELMPKYKPLYEQIEGGLAPLGENEYYKRRHIASNYPETLLSGNSDYITTGDDEEFERVKINNAAEALEAYRNGFRSVDAALGDELEVLFISMYTSYVNGL